MSAAVARTEQKYSIPRNPVIPEPSVLDILLSGTLLKSPDGKAAGTAMPLFRASGEAGSTFAMQKRGAIYYFKHGQLYVYDEAKTAAAQLFEGVALSAGFILPGLGEMAGALSTFVEKGGEMLLEKVGEKINEPKHHGQMTYGDQAKALESRGAVMLPGVSLVDIEYQVEPAGFLSKEVHRLIYTYEDGQHQLTRYQTGATMKGNKSEPANTAIKIALNARMWGELGYLLPKIKDEFAQGFDAIESEMRIAFEQKHGDGTADRSLDFVKEVGDRYQAEVERNGFTVAASAQRALELLEPMRDVYDRTPVLCDMMRDVRALAAGKPA